MALDIFNDNIQVDAPKALDNKHGKFVTGAWEPYDDTTEANSTVLSAYRSKGLTIIVAEPPTYAEYWWKEGIADIDLIRKFDVIPDGLFSGGIVTWNSLLIFDVSPAVYYIAGIRYTSPQTQITLDPADPTDARQDVIALDSTGVIKLTGIPSPNPQEPQADFSQIRLTSVLINAGGVTPASVTRMIIYDENIPPEWTTSTVAGLVANFNNMVNPLHLTKAIDIGAFTLHQGMKFVKSSTLDLNNFSVLKFYIRLKSAFSSLTGVDIVFYNGNVPISSAVMLRNGTYGFNSLITGTYQVISIPLSAWAFSSTIGDTMIMSMSGNNPDGLFIDWVQLQSGIVTTTTNNVGTVTSFSAGGLFNFFSTTVYNPTSTPTLTFSPIDAPANSVWGNNTGSSAAPGYYTLPFSSGVPINNLLLATGTNTIDNANYAQEWQWNTLAGVSALKLSSTSTAAAGNQQKLFEINLSGANATSTQTTYGIYVTNSHTGTSSANYAGYFAASGGSGNVGIAGIDAGTGGTGVYGSTLTGFGVYGASNGAGGIGVYANAGFAGAGVNTAIHGAATGAATTNIGGIFQAINGLTNNYAIIVPAGGGNVGVGTSTPLSKIEVQADAQSANNGILSVAISTGYGLAGSSPNGFGVTGTSTSSVGVQGSSDTSNGGAFYTSNGGNSTVSTVLVVAKGSAAPANGSGGSIDFQVIDDGTDYELSNQLISKWTDVTHATRTSEFSITGVNLGSLQTLMSIGGDGTATFFGPSVPAITLRSITTTQTAIRGDATSGSGVMGLVTSGTGVSGIATSGVGGIFQSNSSNGLLSIGLLGAQITSFDANTATVLPLTRFQRTTTGTAANGLGGSLDIFLEADNGSANLANQIISKWTDATLATRTSQLIIAGVNSGTPGDILTLNGNKSIRFNGYGAGTFTGTPAYLLAEDSSGNVIETAFASGTYTPTVADVTNVTGHTVFDAQYMRVGNVVTVSGRIGIDPNLTATFTQVRISTPVNSTFSAPEQCGGTAVCGTLNGEDAGINADISNANNVLLGFTSINTADRTYYFTFTYQVL